MHVIMVSVGSWGDAEPYLALAKELLSRSLNQEPKHQVDFFVQHQYETRVQELISDKSDDINHNNPFQPSNFQLHALPFGTRDFYKVKPSSSQANADPKLKHVATIAEIMGELVLPCSEWMHSIVTGKSNKVQDQIILSSALSRPLCWLLARATKIPLVLLHLQPLAPNTLFPLYRVSKNQCIQAILDYRNGNQPQTIANTDSYESTYWKIDEPLEEVFLKDRMQRAYQQFGLTPPTWLELQSMLRGKDPTVHIANCYSNQLIPRIANTPGVGPHVYEIGPLADSFLAPNYIPDADLEAFLQNCHATHNQGPICIGFGSMPFGELEAVMDALMELNVSAVLLGAPFQFRSCPAKYQEFVFESKKLFRIAFCPYAYLLPRCSMMLCHGGAGTVHATLWAGIPCLVRPIMGDQFLFASLLQELGLGMEISGPLQAQDIVTVVRQALDSSSSIMANCRQWAQHMVTEESNGTRPHGTVQLSNLLEEIDQTSRSESQY